MRSARFRCSLDPAQVRLNTGRHVTLSPLHGQSLTECAERERATRFDHAKSPGHRGQVMARRAFGPPDVIGVCAGEDCALESHAAQVSPSPESVGPRSAQKVLCRAERRLGQGNEAAFPLVYDVDVPEQRLKLVEEIFG